MNSKILGGFSIALVLCFAGGLFLTMGPAKPVQPASAQCRRPTQVELEETYGRLPLSFEPKKDQTAPSAEFLARGPGYLLSLAPTKAVFALVDPATVQSPGAKHPPTKSAPLTLAINLLGSNPDAMGSGARELKGKAHYFKGNNPALWRTNVPTFGQVRYEGVYPGIDLVYYGNQKRLEYDFVVAPGSDPGTIALAISGAERVEVEPATGDLLLRAGTHTLRQHKPIAYQNTRNGRREIESRYLLGEDGRVGFAIGQYDATTALVIDPVLAYSTYLGGTSNDDAYGIAVDAAGSAYVTGWTQSDDFPVVDSIQAYVVFDVFVTKFSVDGMSLVYSTYLGGDDVDYGFAIALDADGNAYVTGQTESTDFPLANPYQSTLGGLSDAFVAKLSSDGSELIYSTYLGGTDPDQAFAIAVNSAGNAFVAGSTDSDNFPTANALQNTLNVNTDAFVTKLSTNGTTLTYSTFLGGSDYEWAKAIALDSAGNAYITGWTSSLDFPTAHAFQKTNAGLLKDVFVSKLNAAGSALVYSTYLGGAGQSDVGEGIAVDSAGNAYVTGYTNSVDFPLANPIQSALSGDNDAFVTKFNAAGTNLIYSTYLGGTGIEFGLGIALDAAGNAYVVGQTRSDDFPLLNAFQSTLGDTFHIGDAFVTKINPAGGALVYSSYLGGDSFDWGRAIAVDSAGTAYLTGSAFGTFPTVNPFQDTPGGFNDVFVARITDASSSPQTLLNISTRLQVLTDDKVLIGGFIITGTDPKMVILRGIGPSLEAFGIADPLADPVLELRAGDGSLIKTNDNWTTDRTAIEATGLQPTEDLESAIVATLEPGSYTAIMSGKNGGTGVGLVEAYDLDSTAASDLANISTRGFVETGSNVMIGGFILGSDTTVVIRAIGPTLADFGIADALADPTLELHDVQGALIRSNDNWMDDQQDEIEATGLAPSDELESAILETLNPGAYTAIVAGADGGTGVGLVEVYRLP